MKMTTISQEQELIEFVQAASKSFEANPQHSTFTKGQVASGELFAVRWGLGDDCILVFRIGEETPTVYGQSIALASADKMPAEVKLAGHYYELKPQPAFVPRRS